MSLDKKGRDLHEHDNSFLVVNIWASHSLCIELFQLFNAERKKINAKYWFVKKTLKELLFLEFILIVHLASTLPKLMVH
jgi:hypothetical protein